MPSAHMHSLYLSRPSSKYTSPAELGIRVALNITDPLRMMLFSCKEAKQERECVCISLLTPTDTHKALFTGGVKFLTYSLELDVPSHLELHSPAHYVDAFVSTNDSFAVPFNVQVVRGAACDLRLQKTAP